MAVIQAYAGGTKRSCSSRSNTVRMAPTTPAFAATPPTNAMGGLISFPFVIAPLKFLATASQRPFRISGG
ncbi:MAG: hypothetical protein BWY06_00886 [Candidatus Latescibacteria bacterium ADurb.Bin168]|nr:MAG: hypothetical protein BWY06_00886 [Candidatus Latescibacteria bacterium ADurb.Bin168]